MQRRRRRRATRMPIVLPRHGARQHPAGHAKPRVGYTTMFAKGRSTASHPLSRQDGLVARRHATGAKRQPGWRTRTVAGLVFLLSVLGCQFAAAQPLPRSVLVVDPADVRGPFYYGVFS